MPICAEIYLPESPECKKLQCLVCVTIASHVCPPLGMPMWSQVTQKCICASRNSVVYDERAIPSPILNDSRNANVLHNVIDITSPIPNAFRFQMPLGMLMWSHETEKRICVSRSASKFPCYTSSPDIGI